MSTFEELFKKIAEKVSKADPLPGTIKLNIEEGGIVMLHLQNTPPTISDEDAPADCTIKTTKLIIEQIMANEIDPGNAFMMGKLKVEGNMALALNLKQVLQ